MPCYPQLSQLTQPVQLLFPHAQPLDLDASLSEPAYHTLVLDNPLALPPLIKKYPHQLRSPNVYGQIVLAELFNAQITPQLPPILPVTLMDSPIV